MFHNDLLSCEVKEKPDVFVRLRMAVSQEPGQRSTSGSLKKALESQRTKLEGNRCNNSRLSKLSETSEISEALSRCRLWVKSAVLTLRRSLPVCPDQQTFRMPAGMSQTCQIQTHAPQQKGGSIRSLIGARVRGLIRATPPSEGPQSIASSVIVCADPSSRIS
jgi:hypothetical protein